MFISFLGVAASFASVAYRIATSNFLSASLGAVRFCFLREVGWWSGQKICWSHFLWFGVCMCYCSTGSSGQLNSCQIQYREFCVRICFYAIFLLFLLFIKSGALFAVLSYVAIHQPDLRLAIVFLPFFTFSAGSVSKCSSLKHNKSLPPLIYYQYFCCHAMLFPANR